MNTFKASQLAPFLAFGFLPQTIRFAQALRLHIEAKKGDVIDIEVRRRIWWYVVVLDVESTITSGLSPIIRPDDFNTRLPSLFHDEAIKDWGESAPSPPMFSSSMVAMQGYFQWAHRIHTWFRKMPDQAELLLFQRLIENILQLIPNDSDEKEHEWARTFLKMQVDRAYCMLGLRFWQLDHFKGTECQSEVVKTARSFLTSYLHLATIPSHQHFCWFIPGLVQPLHALTIMLMHLSTCSNLTKEEIPTWSLINSIFNMRINRVLSGTILPVGAMIRRTELRRNNPRYMILATLRARIGSKIGSDMGAGDHTAHRDRGNNRMGSKEVVAPLHQPDASRVLGLGLDNGVGSSAMLDFDGNGWNGEAPDMMELDEWGSLTSDFFIDPGLLTLAPTPWLESTEENL
ncbi:MAG: hypothetical protein M1818_002161 [Claussenomyces sp. TS43310]|nr:MAG: hypothetical protein M1818_002161 [Claussenomyces sp. TS43310]